MSELHVAAGLLERPAENAPLVTLCREDFTDPRCRLVFDNVMALWRRHSALTREDAREVCVRVGTELYNPDEAWGIVEYIHSTHETLIYEDMQPERPFLAYCEDVAADGALRRVRYQVGRWYVDLSQASPFSAIGTTAKNYQDSMTTRRALIGLLADVITAARREHPGEAGRFMVRKEGARGRPGTTAPRNGSRRRLVLLPLENGSDPGGSS